MRLVNVVPKRFANSNLSTVPYSAMSLPTNVEKDAVEHWQFGLSAASLTGRVAGKACEVVGSAPTYTDRSIILNGENSYLKTPVLQSDSDAHTILMVFKMPAAQAAKNIMLFGDWNQTRLEGVLAQLRAPDNNYRSYIKTTDGSVQADASRPSDVSTGTWTVASLGRKVAGGDITVTARLGKSARSSVTATAVETVGVNVPNYQIGWGNGTTTGNSIFASVPLEVAEFIIFPWLLSDDEVEAAYFRAAVRSANDIVLTDGNGTPLTDGAGAVLTI